MSTTTTSHQALRELKRALQREQLELKVSQAYPGFELIRMGGRDRPYVARRTTGSRKQYSSWMRADALLSDLWTRGREERDRLSNNTKKG